MIFLNTACLAADMHEQSQTTSNLLSIADSVFTWMFTLEAIFKIIGLGPKCYVRDFYNVFDASVCILSLVDFAITIGFQD